jgi:hypothetical protein
MNEHECINPLWSCVGLNQPLEIMCYAHQSATCDMNVIDNLEAV